MTDLEPSPTTSIGRADDLRVALVHERFTEVGGSEKVVAALHGIWPRTTLHSPLADPAVVEAVLGDVPVEVTWLQRLARADGRYEHLLPLLPHAMRRLDLTESDVVITSHHAFAQRVRVDPSTPVVSYVHSPARWMWDASLRHRESTGPKGVVLGGYAATQRRADRRAAQRVTRVIANSTSVAARIRTWWGRHPEVVPPPVDVTFHHPDPTVDREPFVLLAGRLVPYKRPEVAVAAAAQAGVRMIVAGSGRAIARCKDVADPHTTEFLGPIDDHELTTAGIVGCGIYDVRTAGEFGQAIAIAKGTPENPLVAAR